MKQKDIAIIIVVVAFSAVLSMLVTRFAFNSPQKQQQKAEVVQAISSEFPAPDTQYFNDKAVNTTQPIRIGDNNNSDPFRDATRQ